MTSPKRYLSPREYAAIISMVIASVYLLLISFFPLAYNFTSSFDPLDFLKNLLLLSVGLGNLAGVNYLLQKETFMQRIADETFDRVIYQRLEPVLRDVAEVQVGINNMHDQMEMLNLNIETLSNKKNQTFTAMPGNISYFTKYIVLINITLAVFLFMLQYPFEYIPYMVTILFILWWIAITLEYKLWKVEIAWTWIFFPIIILPISTIIMNGYLADYQLFGLLSFGLCIYIISYYSWCSFKVKGVLPFDLQYIIRNNSETEYEDRGSKNKEIKGKESKEKRATLSKIRHPELNLNLDMFSRDRIAQDLILISIVLFGVTWFGYSIQHNLIPNISWERMGLQGFQWSSNYTYIANVIGIMLIIKGLRMLKPIKT